MVNASIIRTLKATCDSYYIDYIFKLYVDKN